MTLVFRYIVIGVIFFHSTNIIGQNHQDQEYTFHNHQKYIMSTVDSLYYKHDGWIKGYWIYVKFGYFEIKKNKIILGRRMLKEGTSFDINGNPSRKERRAVANRFKILEYHESKDYGPDEFYCDSKFGKLEIHISKDRKYITIVKDSLNWAFHLDHEDSSLSLLNFYNDVTKKTTPDQFVEFDSLDVKPSYRGAKTYQQSTALFLADIKDRLVNNTGLIDTCLVKFSVSKEETIQNVQVISGGSKQFKKALLTHIKYLQFWTPRFKDDKKVETILRLDIEIY